MAKAKKAINKIIPEENIISKIYVIRGYKVIPDMDLAQLYGVETKVLNQAVKRNIQRFPTDFMFQLSRIEYNFLRSQIVTLENAGRGKYSKFNPYVFTEQGVAMLSAVINSPKAIDMNIAIMRAFVEIRKLVHTNKLIAEKMQLLEDRLGEHDVQLKNIYDTIENLLDEKVDEKTKTVEKSMSNRKRIGFKPEG